MSPEAQLAPFLVRQDGLVTLGQAVDAGVSSRTVQRRVRSGGWERVLPRVFLVAGHPQTDAARVRAAALWVGTSGAVSGPAAAWWHGMLPAPPEIIGLTVAREHCPRPQPGVCLRRRTLTPADLVKLRGLWVTDKGLTALETAATVADGSVFLDRALQRHVSFTRVYRAYCRNLGRAAPLAPATYWSLRRIGPNRRQNAGPSRSCARQRSPAGYWGTTSATT